MKRFILLLFIGTLVSTTAIQAEHYRAIALKYVIKKSWGWVQDPYSGKHYRVYDMDVDHIWPRKYGGPDQSWNLVFSGKSENRSKGAKIDYRIIDGYYHKIKQSLQ